MGWGVRVEGVDTYVGACRCVGVGGDQQTGMMTCNGSVWNAGVLPIG